MKSLRNAINVISAFKEYLQRHIDTENEGKKQGYMYVLGKNLKNVTFVMLTANEYFNAVIAGLVF